MAIWLLTDLSLAIFRLNPTAALFEKGRFEMSVFDCILKGLILHPSCSGFGEHSGLHSSRSHDGHERTKRMVCKKGSGLNYFFQVAAFSVKFLR